MERVSHTILLLRVFISNILFKVIINHTGVHFIGNKCPDYIRNNCLLNYDYFFILSVILQRTSVNMGQLKIQGVATCMYLCMDACGLLYGSVRLNNLICFK